MTGYVVAEREIAGAAKAGDTASVRVTIGAQSKSARLEQRVERFGRGRSAPRRLEGRQEDLYVASGTGRLHVGRRAYPLEPNLGACFAAGEEYSTRTSITPTSRSSSASSRPGERRCTATPTTRSSMSSRVGEGVLHLGGRATPIAPASCIHLPPLQEHCLENAGGGTMRVLGVFHPAGDPASRAS
jgi:mannose-6-phosphate isomerase-like protein (cupin superfamily)